jgi:hypothetical protein
VCVCGTCDLVVVEHDAEDGEEGEGGEEEERGGGGGEGGKGYLNQADDYALIS